MNYQRAKFQFCRLSLASFVDRFRKKHNDDVISCCWNFKFSETLYRLSSLQVSNLLVICIKF